MTPEFEDRMKKALANAKEEFERQLAKDVQVYEKHKEYADMFRCLVIDIVGTFSFIDGNFACNEYGSNFISDTIGTPSYKDVSLDFDAKRGIIRLDYIMDDSTYSRNRSQIPNFLKDFQADIVNNYLAADDIVVKSEARDYDMDATERVITISFNAVALIDELNQCQNDKARVLQETVLQSAAPNEPTHIPKI